MQTEDGVEIKVGMTVFYPIFPDDTYQIRECAIIEIDEDGIFYIFNNNNIPPLPRLRKLNENTVVYSTLQAAYQSVIVFFQCQINKWQAEINKVEAVIKELNAEG